MIRLDEQGYLIKTDAAPPFRLRIRLVNGQLEFRERNLHHARARGSEFVQVTAEELLEFLTHYAQKPPAPVVKSASKPFAEV